MGRYDTGYRAQRDNASPCDRHDGIPRRAHCNWSRPPRSATVLVGASRFWERAAARGLSSFHAARRRTLIVGAGRGGRSLLRELRETPGEQVVGFVMANFDPDNELEAFRCGIWRLNVAADAQAVEIN